MSSRFIVPGTIAAAVVLSGLVAWCGVTQVDDGFARTHHSLDLERPAGWAANSAAVAPGTLGRLLWKGQPPLEASFGPVVRGDILKLKLRSQAGLVAVRVRVDGCEVGTLEVGDSWQQQELVSPCGGDRLRLEQVLGGPAPVHVSRVSVTNVRGFVEGPLAVYLRVGSPGAARAPRSLPVTLVLVLAAPLLLLVVAGMRWLGHRDELAAAVGAGICAVLPAALLLVTAGLLELATDLQVVYPSRTFLLLLVGPPAVVAAVRSRRAVWTVLRGLAVGLWALLGRVGERLERSARRLGLDRLTATAADQEGGLSSRGVRNAFLVYLVVVAVLGLLFAALVVGDFGGPMLGSGDVAQWTYQGYYVGHNLSFGLLPHLDLVNDQLLYPYGGSNVFQPWVLDMHLFTATADRLAGPGPWAQLYYLLSVVVCAVGVFQLLVRDHGAYRASLFGIAVSFCSYYAIGKYSGHLGVACTTWLTLNLVADWVLVRRLVLERPWSARLLALRALLLMLVLGQDLSYMAGVALTSFSICALFAAALTCGRARCRGRVVADQLRRGLVELRASARRHPLQVVTFATLALATAWLYLPLVLQIILATRRFDLSLMPSGGSWANPLRFLIPILPGFNPVTMKSLFHDSPEAYFAASPGLFFVLGALLGLVWGRRRPLCWLPFLLLLTLLLSFHPPQFVLLRALPWFTFTRVTGRFSVAYPALLSILCLSAPTAAFRGRRGALLAALGCGLLGVEAVTAYRVALVRPRHYYRPDAAFTQLMGAIRDAPGEAVLEWPFCVAGGNGVGTGEVGRFYSRQAGSSLLQEYHHKKVVGSYFGRLHPEQLRPYRTAGWPRMFQPDDPSPHKARRQRRDFLPAEWEFMERFFVLNDFCGLLLYTDLLPPRTVEGFHRRFGAPAAVADGTPFGRLEFLPKRPEWRGQVDRAAGLALVAPDLPPPRPVARVNLSGRAGDPYLRRGWGGPQKRYRSTEGGAAELAFSLDPVTSLLLTLRASTFQRQRVGVVLNGVKLDESVYDGRGFVVSSLILPADHLKPSNVLRFELPDAHSPKSVGVNADIRELGLTVDWLELETLE